jgi:hypothetical protein
MNKRGFELAISTLVVIIIGALVLGVLIYGFTYGWENFWNTITAFSGGKDNVQSVINACEISCSAENKYDYCSLKRTIIASGNKETRTCNELENLYELNCPAINCE